MGKGGPSRQREQQEAQREKPAARGLAEGCTLSSRPWAGWFSSSPSAVSPSSIRGPQLPP